MISRSSQILIWTLSLSLAWSGCGVYSFTGASVDPSIKTATVGYFNNQSGNGPANLSQQFTEELKDRIVSGTNVSITPSDGDIEFIGSITDYSVAGRAPTGEQTTAFNRLTMTIRIEYINRQDPEQNWSQSFSRFADFENTQTLSSLEDQLIEEIFEQLLDDVFNRAFVNW